MSIGRLPTAGGFECEHRELAQRSVIPANSRPPLIFAALLLLPPSKSNNRNRDLVLPPKLPGASEKFQPPSPFPNPPVQVAGKSFPPKPITPG